jgi:CubicO group peptidase (beta-lactamase class C family)
MSVRGSRPAHPETKGLAEAVAAMLDEWLPKQLRESGVPGAAVTVVDDHGMVWQRAFGYLDHVGSPPIDCETLFCVRSLAKGITALAALVAVQDGLVGLDVPVKESLPDFTVQSRFDPRPEERITLRHLLAHRAGLTHDEPPGNNPDDPDCFRRHILSISDTWLRFPVGYRYAYSNLGFDLVGYILQVRSGMPFAQYVKDNVLAPIGMASSSFDPDVIERSVNRAVGHTPSGKIEPLRFPEIPAAGLYSTGPDMAKYLQFYLGDGTAGDVRILCPDLMKQLRTIQFAQSRQQTGYCLGMFRQLVSNTFSLSHSGGGRGFQSQMIVFPEHQFGVLLLTNKDGHGLTEGPVQHHVDGLIRQRLGPNPDLEPGTEGMRQLPPEDPRIQSILGRYWDGDNWTVGVENGIVGLRTSSQSFYPLTFYDDEGELVGVYGASAEIRFLPSFGDQRGSLLSIDRRLLNCSYRSFNDSPADPPGPGKKEWKAYLGEYEILWGNEPMASVRITQRKSHLYYGEARCIEHAPGLFFTCDGEALDFRSDPPTVANLVMRRKGRQTQ